MSALSVYQSQAMNTISYGAYARCTDQVEYTAYGVQTRLSGQGTARRLSPFVLGDVGAQTTQTGGLINQGLIKEIDCRLLNPWLVQQYVLPLLRHFGQQPRWQLWFTSGEKLSCRWLQQVGLPVDKTLLVSRLDTDHVIQSMIDALQTGNCSVVVGWLPYALADEQYYRLQQAAQVGNTLAIIMRSPSEGVFRQKYVESKTSGGGCRFWCNVV